MYFDQEASCVTYSSYLFGEEGAQMFKKSTVLALHFALSLRFTPGPQSAVHSPQSLFYTDWILIYQERSAHNI